MKWNEEKKILNYISIVIVIVIGSVLSVHKQCDWKQVQLLFLSSWSIDTGFMYHVGELRKEYFENGPLFLNEVWYYIMEDLDLVNKFHA